MANYETAERQVVAALYMDSHCAGDRLLDVAELKRIYNLEVPSKWFSGIVADLEQQGVAMVFWDKDGASALLKDAGFKAAHIAVMQSLGNPATFEINWAKEEVLSEADAPDWFPLPNGWKWFVAEAVSPKTSPVPARAIADAGTPRPTPVRADSPDPHASHIDWQKWGVIFAVVGIIVTIIIALAS